MSLVKSVFKVFDGKQKRKLFGMAFLILINSGSQSARRVRASAVYPGGDSAGGTACEPLCGGILRVDGDGESQRADHGDSDRNCHCLSGKKCVYYFFMNNMQYRFSYYGKREMQDRLMKYYISKDYTFFLNHNSAELMRDINNDPEMFYAAVLNMLQLAAELCTSTILIIFLVVTDPIITLGVALAMMLMVLLFMKS